MKVFKYMEPFDNHYRYRHAVDDHNNLRHSDISLEETWVTHRWENRVFAFLLAVTEVNAYVAFRYFNWRRPAGDVPMTLLQFRRKLAKALIHNEHIQDIDEDTSPRKSKRAKHWIGHEKRSARQHGKSFSARKWILTAKDRYQKYTCRGADCTKRIRTYCSCDIGHWLCDSCWTKHIVEVDTTGDDGEPNWAS